MLSQVCVRVLLVTLCCTVHVGAGILRRSTELEASRETPFTPATIQPNSSSLLTQNNGSSISGEEIGSEQDGQQSEQTESKNSTQTPTASQGRPEYACPLPWSGNTW